MRTELFPRNNVHITRTIRLEINVSRGLFYFPSSSGEISVARLGAELRVARTKAVANKVSLQLVRRHDFARSIATFSSCCTPRVHEREREKLEK